MKALILALHLISAGDQTVDLASKAKAFFNSFNYETLHTLPEFYSEKALFLDPLGQHNGLTEIRDYYARLYKEVKSIRFDFKGEVTNENEVVLFWDMVLEHPSLNSGKEYRTHGSSHLRFEGKGTSARVVYHRDYFDMGEFVYEQLPVLKNLIRYIKDRLKG